jgi:hypothetical protein
MPRDIKRARDRVPVLPTMTALSTPPQTSDNPELARSAGRDGNATASLSDTPESTQALTTDKPATAPLPRSDKPVVPAGAKPATIAARPTVPFEAPTDDTPRTPRWPMIAVIAASLAAAAPGWWLYRSEVATHVEMTIPPTTRASDDLAQVKQALRQERDKAEQLARELATAWRELRSQAVALADNAANNQELTDLRQALQQTERQSEVFQEFLVQERARNRGLEEQLAARLDSMPGRGRNATTSLSDIPGPTRAPATDKPATAALRTSDKPVMAAGDKPATMAALSTASEAPGNLELARTARRDATARLSDTPNPTQAPATDKPATAPLPTSDKPTMPAGDKPATIAARPTAPEAAPPTAAEAPGNPELTRLVARASLLLAQGNIGAARIVLERAAETGSAQALFALAETYDPISLSAWGTLGTQGDVAKAQELYAKALAGGVQEAKERLNALR